MRLVRWVFPKIELISTKLAVLYLEKIFFTPLKYKTPVKELETERAAVKGLLDCQGKKIQLYEWGSSAAPYVMVVHGWAGRATQFRKFVPVFNQAGVRVVGFDGPAHGKSEGKRTSIAEFETVMREIVKQKGVPLAIMAHSFGGGAALFAIRNGLPVTKLINIASPTISDEIIKSFLTAINGSWPTGLRFKEFIKVKFGRPFEDFTAMNIIRGITGLNLMLIHDTEDKEVRIIQAQTLAKEYPPTKMLITNGLGHNRILKDDTVIQACLDFVRN